MLCGHTWPGVTGTRLASEDTDGKLRARTQGYERMLVVWAASKRCVGSSSLSSRTETLLVRRMGWDWQCWPMGRGKESVLAGGIVVEEEEKGWGLGG